MGLSLFFMFISVGICLLVPTVVAVVLAVKRKGNLLMFVLGVASYTSSQLLLRIPLLNELQNAAWFNMFAITQPFYNGLLMALSAGVFEETGRYVALKLTNKGLLTWENGIMFGLGHGGIEAFCIGGAYYAHTIVGVISGSDTAAVLNAPPDCFLMGGVERISAVALHIGFTMLVMYAVKRRSVRLFLLAILAHALADAMIPIFVPLSGWVFEGVFAAFAILSVIFIIKIKPALGYSKHTAILVTQSRLNVM